MKAKSKGPKQIAFVGGGMDAASWLVSDGSRGVIKPYGATWPFARLVISKQSLTFSIALLPVRKSVKPSDVKISLGKLGFMYFRTPDKANDFSFGALNIDSVVRALREHGYTLDESFKRNIRFAKVSVFLQIAIAAVFVGTFLVMYIMHPNG